MFRLLFQAQPSILLIIVYVCPSFALWKNSESLNLSSFMSIFISLKMHQYFIFCFTPTCCGHELMINCSLSRPNILLNFRVLLTGRFWTYLLKNLPTVSTDKIISCIFTYWNTAQITELKGGDYVVCPYVLEVI